MWGWHARGSDRHNRGMTHPETIFLNGAEQALQENETLGQLIGKLGLKPRHVAVEVNLELIPRESHATHSLHAGDRVEIVTLVGGG